MTSNTGPSWPEIAKSAYRAYSASTNNKNFLGNNMPEFDDLPPSIKIAWEAAVRQAIDCSCNPSAIGMESLWAMWIPD